MILRSPSVLMFFLLPVLILLVESHAFAELQFVRTGNAGRPNRISFENVAFPDTKVTHQYSTNPIIQGDNLYAPDMLRVGDAWYCYYGGWKTAGQLYDRIYLGISTDLDPKGPWGEQMIISSGTYIHVNDPTVHRDGSSWIMLYTAAKYTGSGPSYRFRDWINYSTSTDGINFTLTEVVDADHPFFVRAHVSNSGLVPDQTTDQVLGFSFGMTDNGAFTDHDIGFSASQYLVEGEALAQSGTVSKKPMVWVSCR